MGKGQGEAEADDSFDLDVFESEENLVSPLASGTTDSSHLYEHHLHTICAFAIKCPHDSMAVSNLHTASKSTGFWLPYVSINQCYKYDKVAAYMTEFFLKQLNVPCDLQKLLRGKSALLFEKIVLHSIHRIQIPTGEFIERIIYMARWSSSDNHCCKNTAKIKWLPISAVRGRLLEKVSSEMAGLMKRFWGSEVAEYAELLEEKNLQLLRVAEQTIDQVFKYINSTDAPAEIVNFVTDSKFSEADAVKLYSDFVQHCFPSINMSFASFADYFAKVGLVAFFDETSLRAIFRAMKYKEPKGFLTFNEFLIGIIALDPASPNTAPRHSFIFRYYDTNSDGTIDATEIRQLCTDLQQAQPPEKWANKSTISFTNFQAEVESKKLSGTTRLCRAKQSIMYMIHSSSVYELIISRNGRPFGKQQQPTCVKCRPKNYQLAMHSVRLTKSGTIDDPQGVLNQGDSQVTLNLSKECRLPIDVRRIHSMEFVFKSSSNANYVLNLVRRLSGLKQMTDEKAKEVRAHVTEGLNVNVISRLCNEVTEVVSVESRIPNISTPCTILGDIHGNINDLLTFEEQLWPMAPSCQAQNVLFLGDYVDRGDYSLEVVCYLFAMKVLAPTKFFILRGNHEIRQIQKLFTFEKDCNEKYGSNGHFVSETLNAVFDSLPFAAIVDEQIFCAHGGIPSSMSKVDLLSRFPNVIANPQKDAPAVWEILWADPIEAVEIKKIGDFARKGCSEETGFYNNTKRGTGFFFAEAATNHFLNQNGFSYVIRAHEMIDAGYKFNHNGKVITIFSCSHYLGGTNKAAAIMVEAFSSDGFIKILQLDTP